MRVLLHCDGGGLEVMEHLVHCTLNVGQQLVRGLLLLKRQPQPILSLPREAGVARETGVAGVAGEITHAGGCI